MCKKLIKNSKPIGKKFMKTIGVFLTHTVQIHALLTFLLVHTLRQPVRCSFWLSQRLCEVWTRP